MKRRSGFIVLMCLCFMFLLGMTTRTAAQGEFKYEDVPNGIQITNYTGNDKNVVIPEKIDGKTVIGIGESTFYTDSITSVQIPATVKTISKRAFYECRNLTTVTFTGEGLETVGEEAFSFCRSLTQFTMPTTVKSIGNSAFKACGFQGKIDLSNYTLVMGKQCFYSCNGITEFILPHGITTIPEYTFARCSSLQTVTIQQNTITSIGDNAFTECLKLQNINLPESLVSIGSYAFYGCESLLTITIPKAVNTIGENAFYTCGLKTVYCAYGTYAYYLFKSEYNVQIVGYGSYLEQEIVNIMVGEKFKLKMVNDNGNTTFTSSKPSVATVSATGVVVGKKSGKTVITAVNGDVTSTCIVYVKQIKLNLSKAKITEGFSLKLSLNCTGKVKWSSSNKKIATISSKGKIMAKKPGKVTITAKRGNKKYTCKVTVYKNEMKYSASSSDLIIPGTTLRTVRISKEKGCYVTEMIISNNSDYDIIRLDCLDYKVYASGKLLLSKQVRDMPLNVPAHSQQTIRLEYRGSEIVNKKKIDLRNVILTESCVNGKVTYIVYR